MHLPEGYHPSENEPFMNERQLAYFKRWLRQWRTQILHGHRSQKVEASPDEHDAWLRAWSAEPGDPAIEEAQTTRLVLHEREQKFVEAIDQALLRIDTGDYGYCEDTGEPIELRRLLAYPIATLSLASQRRRENRQHLRSRVHRRTGETALPPEWTDWP